MGEHYIVMQSLSVVMGLESQKVARNVSSKWLEKGGAMWPFQSQIVLSTLVRHGSFYILWVKYYQVGSPTRNRNLLFVHPTGRLRISSLSPDTGQYWLEKGIVGTGTHIVPRPEKKHKCLPDSC